SEITNGLAYLNSTQNPDGSWGDETSDTEVLPATVAVIAAMQALGETSSQNYNNAISWIQNQSIETTDYLSRRIHALSVAGTDEDMVLSYIDETYTNAWGGYEDFDVNNLDTALVLSALKAVNHPDLETISYALSYLIYNQNTDGGFGFYPDDDSNVYMTALVLKVFASYNETFDLQEEIDEASAYLLSRQNPDGGFGTDTDSTVYETALAFEALVESGQGSALPMQNAINHLQTTQQPDGSWNNEPYSTALALRALSKIKPNLEISEENIIFSKPVLMQGDTTTITAYIHNKGPAEAENIVVQFYEGNPAGGGIQIGEDILISSIRPYTRTFPPVSVEYDTSGTSPGRHDIYAVIDPAEEISELKENDNTALKSITVIKQIDLSINSSDIVYFPTQPTPDTEFKIMARVYNLGETVIGSITVALYDGDPGQGGTRLAEDTIPRIYPMKNQYIDFDLSGQSIGEHNYYISVDPDNRITESDKSNNTGRIDIEIYDPDTLPPGATDLYINNTDITIEPPYPETGESMTINAVVHSTANRSITDVDVTFYNGDPGSGGTLLGTVNTWVAQWSSQSVSYTWTMPAGVPVIYIVVDKDNKIAENTETNNTAHKTINTYAADLSVTERDVSLDPLLPEKGQPATINVSVKNLGSTAASGTVSVYEINSPSEKTLIGTSGVSVAGSGKATVSIEGWNYPVKSSTISVVLDNISPEDSDPSNNRSTITYGESIRPGESHEGREFWIVWPETHFGNAQIIVQSRTNADVKVVGPFLSWAGRVSPGTPALIPLIHWGTTEVRSSGLIEDKGIHISSDEDISVIFRSPLTADIKDDAYLAIPAETLGTEYYNISYDPLYGVSNSHSRITIVAPNDNTNISIDGAIVNLNKGQTYQIKSNEVDYTGFNIRSDKPVTVISGVTCTYIPEPYLACDTLLAQGLPVSLWGDDYLTAPLYSPEDGEFIRILASMDNTTVTVNRGEYTETITLDKGRWEEIDTETATHISSNNPIEVAQFAKGRQLTGTGDPLEMIIIPTDKLRTNYIFYTPVGYEEGNFATVIAPEPGTNITLDGEQIEPEWSPLPDKGNYALLPVTEGEHTITSDKPIAVYSHGYRWYGSYGYPAGFGIPLPDLALGDIQASPADPTEGQPVKLQTTLSNLGGKRAENVLLRAYSGDPENGGVLLGDSIIDIIYPMETLPVEITWDTSGFRATNSIYVVADPLNNIEEENENNNTSFTEINVTEPLKPDPAIEDAVVSPETAEEGETVTVSAVIKNRGSDVGNIPVSLYLGMPENGGTLLGSTAIRQIIPLNSEVTVYFTIRTTGLEKENDLFISIDPENIIDELNENNNTAVRHLKVTRKKISLQIITDRSKYEPQSDVGIIVNIRNENMTAWSGTGNIYIEDLNGRQIEHIAEFNIENLRPLGIEGWHYRVPVTVLQDRTMKNAVAFADIDFNNIFSSPGITGGNPDINSIRMIEFDAQDNVLGEKKAKFYQTGGFSAGERPTGKLIWFMDGTTPQSTARYFYMYFDTTENGPKQPPVNTDIPEKGRLIAFTILGGGIYTINSNSDGTFGETKLIDKLDIGNPRGIITRDFNNDGFSDIITGDKYGDIYYYENTADGSDTFLTKHLIGNIGSGSILEGITSADYNKDGNEDFIINMFAADMYLFLGNGDGTFISTKITDGTTIRHTGKASADMDGDGNIDLVVADGNIGSKTVWIYYGNGDGTFYGPVKAGEAGDNLTGIAAGDTDGNEYPDIIAGTSDGTAYLIKQLYTGIFEPAERLPSLDTGYGTAYDMLDINTDNTADIIAAQRSPGELLYFQSNGDGTFMPPVTITAEPTYIYSVSASRINPETEGTTGVAEHVPQANLSFTWNTGKYPPGNYRIYITLSESEGNIIAEDYTDLEILPDISVDSRVATDRISYSANETAIITGAVTSLSKNTILRDIAATISITGGNAAVLYTETKSIPILTPGQLTEFNTYWNTGTNPPGEYTVTLRVRDASGNILSTGTETFTINSAVKPSAGLQGRISADRQSILQGEPVNITYSVTNTGNTDLPQVDLSIITVHVVELTAYGTLTDRTALLMGQTYTNTQQLNTENYTAKDYLVILRGDISGVEETLASTYFRVQGAPTAPSLDFPADRQDVETLTPELSVNNATDPNDDELTYEFELYSDSGLSNLLSSSGMIVQGQNTTSWQVPVELQENAVYHWRARAYDGLLYGDWMTAASFRVNLVNDPPTAPSLSSPADNSEVDTFTPILTVNNASDPDSDNLTYNFQLALDTDFTQIIAAETGISEGEATTSWQVPVSLSENTYYYWRAQADDWLTQGPWMTPAGFLVNTANDAPTAPPIIYPSNGSEITALYTDIIVSNSTDPDSGPLTYIFEADTAATFDSPDIKGQATYPKEKGQPHGG
ncbi:MAG: hypothetical protein GXP46_05115, partial [Deferribacteres bacterium]|nr:hypothetical protein [Deferribacteres bacterium]